MSARTTKLHSAAIKVLRSVKTNTKYFSAIFFFIIPYHLAFPPPRMFSSFSSPSSCHTCMCLLCFSAIVATTLPDAHKMGLSGKTFAPHISHKGSLWPITVLMEARDSHQLHAFFPSHVWTAAKAHCQRGVVSGSGITSVQRSGT